MAPRRSARIMEPSPRGPEARSSSLPPAPRRPLDTNMIEAGDQLHLRGTPDALARLIRHARLLEVGRQQAPVRAGRAAAMVVGIYAFAVLLAAVFGISTTAVFIAAALAICL